MNRTIRMEMMPGQISGWFSKLRILSLVAAMLFPVAVFPSAAQSVEEFKAMTDSILNPPVLEETVLDFPEKTFEIGTLTEKDKPFSHTFRFVNTGSEEVLITRINTSCSCLSVSCAKETILPGKESSVTLTFNPRNFSGDVFVKAFVYTALSDRKPAAVLSLTGEVFITDKWRHLPLSMGNLRLKRRTLEFSDVRADNLRYERIPCANTGEKPMELSAVLLPEYAAFETFPAVIEPGEEADIVLTIDARKMAEQTDRTRTNVFHFLITGTGGFNPFRKTIKVTVHPLDYKTI